GATVVHGEHDPHHDAVALEALGRWMMKFSSIVAPSNCHVAATPASQLQKLPAGYGLFLDVTGCHRVFHGLENLLRLVDEALKKLRITARLAVAPTPGAAWALASFACSRDACVAFLRKIERGDAGVAATGTELTK